MTEKQKEILKAMQGMTYIEWFKLCQVVNIYFDDQAGKIKKALEIASPETIATEYDRLF